MTANGYEICFGGDGNILEWTVMLVVQHHECPGSH